MMTEFIDHAASFYVRVGLLLMLTAPVLLLWPLHYLLPNANIRKWVRRLLLWPAYVFWMALMLYFFGEDLRVIATGERTIGSYFSHFLEK